MPSQTPLATDLYVILCCFAGQVVVNTNYLFVYPRFMRVTDEDSMPLLPRTATKSDDISSTADDGVGMYGEDDVPYVHVILPDKTVSTGTLDFTVQSLVAVPVSQYDEEKEMDSWSVQALERAETQAAAAPLRLNEGTVTINAD